MDKTTQNITQFNSLPCPSNEVAEETKGTATTIYLPSYDNSKTNDRYNQKPLRSRDTKIEGLGTSYFSQSEPSIEIIHSEEFKHLNGSDDEQQPFSFIGIESSSSVDEQQQFSFIGIESSSSDCAAGVKKADTGLQSINNDESLRDTLQSIGYSQEQDNIKMQDIITDSIKKNYKDIRKEMLSQYSRIEQNPKNYRIKENAITDKDLRENRNIKIKLISNILEKAVNVFLNGSKVEHRGILGADKIQRVFTVYDDPKDGETFLSHYISHKQDDLFNKLCNDYGAFQKLDAYDKNMSTQDLKLINNKEAKIHTFNNIIPILKDELFVVVTSSKKDTTAVISKFTGAIEINNRNLIDFLGIIFFVTSGIVE